MSDIRVAVDLKISFSLETLAAIDRVANAFGLFPSSPSPAIDTSPVQPVAPGGLALDDVSSLEPAEGPSRAAGETCPARPETARRILPGEFMTEERKARLAELWPTAAPIGEIRAALERLKGPQLGDNKQLGQYAFRMGLRRHPSLLPGNLPQYQSVSPAADLGEPPLSRMDTIRRVAASLSVKSNPPIVPERRTAPYEAGQETIRAWAADRGLQMDKFDLDAVNRKATSIGHPGFILRQPERRRPS